MLGIPSIWRYFTLQSCSSRKMIQQHTCTSQVDIPQEFLGFYSSFLVLRLMEETLHLLRLVVYPIIYKGLCILAWFIPSTVCVHLTCFLVSSCFFTPPKQNDKPAISSQVKVVEGRYFSPWLGVVCFFFGSLTKKKHQQKQLGSGRRVVESNFFGLFLDIIRPISKAKKWWDGFESAGIVLFRTPFFRSELGGFSAHGRWVRV